MAKTDIKQSSNSRWEGWMPPNVIMTLAGACVVLLGAVGLLGYFLFYRVPDIEKKIEKLEEAQLKFQGGSSNDQKYRFDQIEKQLASLRINVVRLCAQGKQIEKTCDVNELVNAIAGIANIHSQNILNAAVKLPAGEKPAVRSLDLRKEFALLSVPQGSTPNVTNSHAIANAMVWAAGADNANWSVSDGKIKATFLNGTATFSPRNSISNESVNKMVVELNQASDIFKEISDKAGETEK